MKIVCVIPARLASSRFPKKVLAMLGEKPMLQWVWEAASSVDLFDDVAFAVDDSETERLIDSFEGKHFMTSPDCPSGTDRLIELQSEGKMQGDIWVNWQGDEPFIHQEMIENLLQTTDEAYDIWSLRKEIEREEDIEDPNVVKVVTDPQDRALYFSRSPIPYDRDGLEDVTYYKHVGIYAYTADALKQISTLSPSLLEKAEGLEQLRFLENGMNIQVHETAHESLGIDIPEDLARAMDRISSQVLF
ncbi:3-deoxy-manno-octulosonate cytidylyltransferase [Candidatus Neptunichlamydia sp. REUL1]|uniref:3-deoxy-manno-octulosonate cytidylyltransferase n=1 Tax=Candidatus Neptunichlamydia sp. REUL1 TaxID=3064277 RepID=UPI00292DA069|nr:3-deoxy-manno-octulosonate cytidylyltransferase [Candidatus Neptunochlamydia sp. REUL1]